jgi:hypothetical protein
VVLCSLLQGEIRIAVLHNNPQLLGSAGSLFVRLLPRRLGADLKSAKDREAAEKINRGVSQ